MEEVEIEAVGMLRRRLLCLLYHLRGAQVCWFRSRRDGGETRIDSGYIAHGDFFENDMSPNGQRLLGNSI